jgi:ATP-dependent Lhr-like helicase
VDWWTFAGARANASLAASLGAAGIRVARHDNFSITTAGEAAAAVHGAIAQLRSGELPVHLPAISDDALEGLKFSVCLPDQLARTVLEQRAHDEEAVRWVKQAPTRLVSEGPN